MVINPIAGVYIPIIRIPIKILLKVGWPSPTKRDFWPCHMWKPTLGRRLEPLCQPSKAWPKNSKQNKKSSMASRYTQEGFLSLILTQTLYTPQKLTAGIWKMGPPGRWDTELGNHIFLRGPAISFSEGVYSETWKGKGIPSSWVNDGECSIKFDQIYIIRPRTLGIQSYSQMMIGVSNHHRNA